MVATPNASPQAQSSVLLAAGVHRIQSVNPLKTGWSAPWPWAISLVVLALGVPSGWTLHDLNAQESSQTSRWLLNTPKPKPVEPMPPDQLEAAIRRGLDFLLQDQNENGSWGSATRTKGLNIYAPVPGAHQAFRAAVTSLCLSALIESGDSRPEIDAAIERGWIWLVQHLPAVRRAEPEAIYNVWTHAYAIEALADLHRRFADDPDRQTRAVDLIRQQVQMLNRYEGIDGGWGYYDFGAHTQQPNVEPTSFTTATALIALRQAQQLGVAVPERMVRRAVVSLERQKKPDYSYFYSDNGPVSNRPMWEINRPGGSLGRSQSCNLALRMWGDKSITDRVLTVWLDRLFAQKPVARYWTQTSDPA